MDRATWTIPAARMKGAREHRVPLAELALVILAAQAALRDDSGLVFIWCADSGKPAEIAEAALAHAIGDKVEAAYRRSDLFDRRRALMGRWAEFVTTPPAEVVALRAR